MAGIHGVTEIVEAGDRCSCMVPVDGVEHRRETPIERLRGRCAELDAELARFAGNRRRRRLGKTASSTDAEPEPSARVAARGEHDGGTEQRGLP